MKKARILLGLLIIMGTIGGVAAKRLGAPRLFGSYSCGVLPGFIIENSTTTALFATTLNIYWSTTSTTTIPCSNYAGAITRQ